MSAANALTNALLVAICQRWPSSVLYRHNVIKAQVKMTNGTRWVQSSPPGVSDIMGVLAPSGRMVCIEIKTGKDRLSPVQRTFQDAVNKAGGIAIVARSVEDAMKDIAWRLAT